MLDDLKKWYSQNKDKILKSYFDFLRFKTVSASQESKNEMIACSSWLCNYLKSTGLDSEIVPTSTFPIVYAEKIVDDKAPVLLIYGHYDVQPTDPLNEWRTDPFEPVVRDNKVYARGASDNKGQIFYAVVAIQAYLKLFKNMKINLKFCIEGEEETKSSGLFLALPSLKEKLRSDYLLVVDFSIPNIDEPAITLGMRGLSALSVEFTGSSTDLHSGEHGGLAYNPLRAAVEVLARFFDENGKISVDGFYDDVKELSFEEKKTYDLEFDEVKYQKDFGIKKLSKEKGFSAIESNWIRPTLEINGIGGGYFLEGFKTVIPAKVQVKISARLVPDQDPEKIASLVKIFLEKNIPKQIDIKVTYEGGGKALRAKSSSPLAKAAKKAYTEVFGKPCKKILAGGSVPIIAQIVKEIKCSPVMIGVSLASDNIHAPNEHFGLDRFEKGFLTCARIVSILEQEIIK